MADKIILPIMGRCGRYNHSIKCKDWNKGLKCRTCEDFKYSCMSEIFNDMFTEDTDEWLNNPNVIKMHEQMMQNDEVNNIILSKSKGSKNDQ